MKCLKPTVLALALTCALAGCKSPPTATVTVFGLWPEQPSLRWKPYSAWSGGNCYVWPQMDTAQPVLAWEIFPRPADLASDTNRFFAQFKSVTYDLRIWRSERQDDIAGKLVYARDALPKPSHRLEVPMSAGYWYFWTVRARFELNDQTRVTEWSYISSPNPAGASTPLCEGMRYPDPRYFRFYICRANSSAQGKVTVPFP